MKKYILLFLSTSSILDVVLRTVEPDSDVSDEILGYTIRNIKTPIIAIKMQCPNSCNLASILGKANQMVNEPIKTKTQLINVFKSYPDIARVMTLNIKDKILIPKTIFCLLLMFLSIPLLDFKLGIISASLIVTSLINLIITGFQLIEIGNLNSQYSALGEYWVDTSRNY